MSLKESIEHWVPPGLIAVGKLAIGKTSRQKIKRYLRNGRIPWSPGYKPYQQQVIQEALKNQSLLDIFKLGKPLPKEYGLYLDERCVEYPWLFSRLPEAAHQVLDAGSVLNFEYLLDQLYFSSRRLHIVTLAPEYNCFWQKGISYLFADLRNLPIKDDFYDSIICLSTLEHVGLDNTKYTQYSGGNLYSETRSSDYTLAVKELVRILKPGGELFLSIPFGKHQNFGDFQQFDAILLADAIAALGPVESINKTFFKYTSNGWQIAAEDDCATCEYAHALEWANAGKTVASGQTRSTDQAAAARAVACIHIVR